MIVINKRESQVELTRYNPDDPGQPFTHNLLIGANSLPDADWQLFKDHFMTKALLRAGTLVEHETVVIDRDANALAEIQACTDQNRLRRMVDSPYGADPELRAAIIKRHTELNPSDAVVAPAEPQEASYV